MTGTYFSYMGPTVRYLEKTLYFFKATHFPTGDPPFTQYSYKPLDEIIALKAKMPDREPDEPPIRHLL